MTRFGHIAQLVEQGTENPCVPSSILGVATTFKIEREVLPLLDFFLVLCA